MSTEPVTVYSKPRCVQCKATIRALEVRGIGYRIVDVAEDLQAREYIQGLGYMQAPVVVTAANGHWSGFRPDKIEELVQGTGADGGAA